MRSFSEVLMRGRIDHLRQARRKDSFSAQVRRDAGDRSDLAPSNRGAAPHWDPTSAVGPLRIAGRRFCSGLDSWPIIMGIRDHPTAPHSPWQNGQVERVIGSIRRECLDHVIVFGEGHLRRLLKTYASY
ncbi:integrase core domain-containing protein [Candidatus Binatus sp.]|uniref:integrase core domain-containing protein n=1 Tax=Candidatus Binatus sp. TaxID=2811406 RepID=UPI003C723C65